MANNDSKGITNEAIARELALIELHDLASGIRGVTQVLRTGEQFITDQTRGELQAALTFLTDDMERRIDTLIHDNAAAANARHDGSEVARQRVGLNQH